MNKKGRILLRDFLIALVLFGLIITLGGLIVTDIGSHYDVANMSGESFQKTYSTLQEMQTKTSVMKNATEGGGGLKTIGTFTVILSGTWTVFQLVFSSIDLVSSTISSFAATYIPSEIAVFVGPAILTIIVVVIIFIIISAVLKGPV